MNHQTDTTDERNTNETGTQMTGLSVVDRQLLMNFNDTEQPYDADKTIVDQFEQQVSRTPQNVALHFGEDTMTYAELNARANQLARHLTDLGARMEDNIGIIAARNFDLIIGVFAILKCGGAYVPVEPDYPADRQKYMLSRSSVKFVITNIDSHESGLEDQFIFVRTQQVPFDNYSTENLGLNINSRQLAYTIYTSGSTGLPKGVMIEHHSVNNLTSWVNQRFGVNENDRLLFVTPICFDLSVYDIFGILTTGGSVVIAEKADLLNVAKLSDVLHRYNITFWNSVPTTMDHLVSRLAAVDADYKQNSLRVVLLSGDWIPVLLPEKIKHYFPNTQVISMGGATEATVWSNYYPVETVNSSMKSIPYGVPIGNNSYYILDDNLEPVALGETGELYIGGVGVARGYANDPEKTAHAFLPDPFTKKWGGKMYRTGDLGRMMPEMMIELLGRKDTQVKIRGHRVELGEIEYAIRQNASVENVVVLYLNDTQQLAAYIIPGRAYDLGKMVAYVRAKLPDYMVPNKWIELQQMPLTANGKIDKKALRECKAQQTPTHAYIAPRTEMEETLAIAWREVLGIPDIGIGDNFFDIGGQSLLAVELVTKMEQKIGRSLPVDLIYKHPTIRELSVFVQQEIATADQRKLLIPIKPSGSKVPLYIVNGDGLSLSNFHNLGQCVDDDQPVYSFYPIGLNGGEEPENITEIARRYVEDILGHDPDGPYALAGYSFGGYVVIEMKKIMEAMGKQVKMLAIFDTDAGNVLYQHDWQKQLPLRIKRQIPKFFFVMKNFFADPVPTLSYQAMIFAKKVAGIFRTLGVGHNTELKGIKGQITKITETHQKAFRHYRLTSFNDKVYLFKAKLRQYFVDDFKYLGWADYAQQGVSVFEVPGDHKTMFHHPNVKELGRLLQHALDNC